MLKLKLQYFGHLMQRADSLGKTLMLGKIEARRRRGQQRMKWLDVSPTQGTCIWASSRSWWWTGKPGMLESMGSQRVRQDWVTDLNWTEHNWGSSRGDVTESIRTGIWSLDSASCPAKASFSPHSSLVIQSKYKAALGSLIDCDLSFLDQNFWTSAVLALRLDTPWWGPFCAS